MANVSITIGTDRIFFADPPKNCSTFESSPIFAYLGWPFKLGCNLCDAVKGDAGSDYYEYYDDFEEYQVSADVKGFFPST